MNSRIDVKRKYIKQLFCYKRPFTTKFKCDNKDYEKIFF